jgi:hypothetical protein
MKKQDVSTTGEDLMRRLLIAGFLISLGSITTSCWGQDPASPQAPAPQDQAQTPAEKNQTVTVAAGTRIPLSLTGPITNKAARPGAPVRAVTGFPVTVGTQLAIPAGAYLDGVIDHVDKRGRYGPTVQMHFTRLIFPNGYTVPLDGKNLQAKVLSTDPAPEASILQTTGGPAMSFAGQQTLPPLPPLPHSGPSTGLIVGGLVGTAAVGILALVFAGHHRGNAVLFDSGWQFDMALQTPLVIDLGSAAISGGQ